MGYTVLMHHKIHQTQTLFYNWDTDKTRFETQRK